jgi:hypothetical protein
MKYAFHPEAKAEFLAATDSYEDRESGLGSDFAIEVHSTIENILSFPHAWPLLEDDIRRCLIRRFPYGIIYSQDEDCHLHPCCDALAPGPGLLERTPVVTVMLVAGVIDHATPSLTTHGITMRR